MTGFVLRARWLLSALLVIGAALFAVGVAAERNSEDDHRDEPVATQVDEGEEAEPNDAAETAKETQADEAGDRHEQEEGGESVLGINAESTPLVVIGVGMSIAFAVLVWFRRDRWLLWTVAAFAALFTVFDVAEMLHQIDEDRTGIAVIAGVLAVVHASATLVAGTRATNETATP